MKFELTKIDKKSVVENLISLERVKKKAILLRADKEIRADLYVLLRGWVEALIKCLELFSLLFEFYPKKFMEKKAQAINKNLSDLAKATKGLR